MTTGKNQYEGFNNSTNLLYETQSYVPQPWSTSVKLTSQLVRHSGGLISSTVQFLWGWLEEDLKRTCRTGFKTFNLMINLCSSQFTIYKTWCFTMHVYVRKFIPVLSDLLCLKWRAFVSVLCAVSDTVSSINLTCVFTLLSSNDRTNALSWQFSVVQLAIFFQSLI